MAIITSKIRTESAKKIGAKFAAEMLNNGVYVVAFSYPVVAKGMARIRPQMSASFSKEDLDSALNSFALAKDEIL